MILDKTQLDNILNAIPISLQNEIVLDNIAETIVAGIVTKEEIINIIQSHGVEASIQNLLNSKISQFGERYKDQEERNLWDICDEENTIDAYRRYLSKYPNGKYSERANRNINSLIIDNSKYFYIEEVKRDINSYGADELSELGITLTDLLNAGVQIPSEIQDVWLKSGIDLQFGEKTDKIPKGKTEVYFWGTTSSGKTCTLAALLSRAKQCGLIEFLGGNGRMYMTQLSNIFVKDAAVLPPGTSTDKNQALLCNLRDSQKNEHPMALIEIAGEIYKCFSRQVNHLPIPPEYQETYKDLLSYLSNNTNKKYHFFIIDVTNDKIDKHGLTQMDYLADAATFFNENNIFGKNTAGINLIVTKSDLLADNQEDRGVEAINLLKKKYINFVESLRTIAYKHKLIPKRDAMLDVYPFSVGSVFFKNLCIFDSSTADDIISVLQHNIAKFSERNGIKEFFKK